MEFSFDPGQATYRIESYDQKGITIKGQIYSTPLIVSPEYLLNPWQVDSIANLDTCHFEGILNLKPQIILLGTGKRLQFPKQNLYLYLAQQGVGLEAMTTAAACRTYAILIAEERRVAAALLV